ncbi:MAG: substrate-binding domain-containing protein [Gammaproteobacteria bacterium]|nr:substrate-binding domain-containing protein [Gammaproteobacteria bacterium]
MRQAVMAISWGIACVAAVAALAGEPVAPPMVDWPQPAARTNPPQSDAEKERGKRVGRDLPTAELLQPTLDPALPKYVPRSDVRIAGHFTAAASDVLAGLARNWCREFSRIYPRVTIDVPPPYAGSLGAKELVKGSIDFVFVSRELKPDDITGFQARFGYPPLSVPISGGTYRHFGFLDAMVFMVHPDNPLTALTFAQLDAIYSSTRHRGGAPITTWGQLGLGGEWADKPIHAYGIRPWNGFEEFIRQRILSRDGLRGEWRPDIRYSEMVYPLAARVAGDRYGIGYTGVAYLDAPVRVLALRAQPGADYQAPSYENVARGSYPLSRLAYFNVNRAPDRPLNPAIEELLRFIRSRDGQRIVAEQGIFLPLRAAQLGADPTAATNSPDSSTR